MSVDNHSVVHAMCLWVTEEAAQHSSRLWVAPWKAWHACNSLAVIFQHVRGHLTEHTVDDDLLLIWAGRQHSSSSVKSVSFRIDSSRVYLSAAYGRSWGGQRARRLRLLLLLLLPLLLSGSAAILDSHRGRESDLLLLLLPPSSSPPPLLPLPLTMLPLLMLLVSGSVFADGCCFRCCCRCRGMPPLLLTLKYTGPQRHLHLVRGFICCCYRRRRRRHRCCC